MSHTDDLLGPLDALQQRILALLYRAEQSDKLGPSWLARDRDQQGYLLADLSERYPPAEWVRRAAAT